MLASVLQEIERPILHWATCTIHAPWLQRALGTLQSKDVAVPFLVAGVALVLWARGRGRAARALLALGMGIGLALGLGDLVWRVAPRARPQRVYAEILREPAELAVCASRPRALALRTHGSKRPSFPSHHALTGGVATAVLWLAWRPLGGLAGLWALLVALGRLHAGKHWPTDVLGGLALGILVGWGCWRLLPLLLARVGARWLLEEGAEARAARTE